MTGRDFCREMLLEHGYDTFVEIVDNFYASKIDVIMFDTAFPDPRVLAAAMEYAKTGHTPPNATVTVDALDDSSTLWAIERQVRL